jgi:hypothetical protein
MGLVYLMVEVQSDSAEGDRYRMLLQAACMARLGRYMFKQPFIVFALHIENSGQVTRYFVFQSDGDGDKVCASESEQSRFFFLLALGFLCRRRAGLDATAPAV